MVRDKLWAAAGMQDGFLCVGSLEQRIGRMLRPKDFTRASINNPDHSWDTPRLAARGTQAKS